MDISKASTGTPVVLTMRVIPVAGHDSMLLNLGGAHGPFFTRLCKGRHDVLAYAEDPCGAEAR